MTLNTLRIDVVHISDDDAPQFEHSTFFTNDIRTLWRVWVDDVCITETAFPFHWYAAAIGIIEASPDTDERDKYFYSYEEQIAVRALGKTVVWLPILNNIIGYYSKPSIFDERDFFAFDAAEYIDVCTSALARTPHIPTSKSYLQLNVHITQQFDDVDEFRLLLRAGVAPFKIVYREDAILYREPPREDDPTGSKLVNRMLHALDTMRRFHACPTPEKNVTVRIGIDDMDVQQAVWHIGLVNGRYAIYFEQHPHFPLWLQFDTLNDALEGEFFFGGTRRMKISTLRIEPHTVKADMTRSYFSKTAILWRVWLNGELITENAHPFDWGSAAVMLTTDHNYPILFDGDDYVNVRKLGEHFLWMEQVDGYLYDDAEIVKDTTYAFAANDYIQVCQAALLKSGESTSQLAQFQMLDEWQDVRELNQIIAPFGFDTADLIFREPANADDKFGKKLVNRMSEAIKNMQQFNTCEPPEETVKVQIGIDDFEFRLALWHIGKVNGRYAIYFEQHPHFPLWLQFDTLSDALEGESFFGALDE